MTALRTSLYDFHSTAGARFVEFGGWEMPVSYTSIIEEHRAVREAAGLFDVSHMGEFSVTGTEAEAFLDNLVTNKIAGTAVGRAVYSPMCEPSGGVVDDLIVYRTDEESFLVCVNASNTAKDWAWFNEQVGDFDCRLEDKSADFALLALQGPKAESILLGLSAYDLSQLKRFWHVSSAIADIPVRICRTGYTGEDGFEIYCPMVEAPKIAETLLVAGQSEGLKLCGLGARDSLRLEAGYPLYGHELSADISPLQGGIGWTVKLKKKQFIGQSALQAQQASGVNPRVVHFLLEGRRIAREGADVLAQGEIVGRVLSGTMSPVLNQPIGSALVDFEKAGSADLVVDLRGNPVPLQVTLPPLHQRK